MPDLRLAGNRHFALFLALPVLLFLGCVSTQVKKNPSPMELLKIGRQELKLNDSIEARKYFQQILEDYPDSRERIPALLLLADTHFKDEEYEEAKFHYRKFIELYPAHKFVDRAHYYKAMCDFKMMEIASRDQTPTKAALAGFELMIKNFPDSPYRKPAMQKRDQCLENLANHVFEIGKFYFRTKSYQSAISRFNSLEEQYPNHSNTEEALFLIAESYYNEQNYDKAKTVYRQFLKQYPRSLFSREARDRLRALR